MRHVIPDSPGELRGRRRERVALGDLLEGVRAGRSAALVVYGEPGVGKTALLNYAVSAAPDLTVLRAAGVESEMELAFAALHRMCRPVLDHLGQVPGPQRDALRTAFGMQAGPPPDRFLISLAVLTLLAEAASGRPLVCVLDDVQWLDRSSVQALAFAARRLVAESVLVLFAAREQEADLRGLPELVVSGLRDADAREVLRSAVRWPLDERVAEQIVAEAQGNPLALLELPRTLSPAQLGGGFGLPAAVPLPGTVEDSFRKRIDGLPGDTRQLLVLAAAEPTGDPTLVWHAARLLGIPDESVTPAVEADLVEIGARVRFRHPLVRSALYRSASPSERQAVHRALAEVTDIRADPDRRAWHRAQAAADMDDDVAADLERSAGLAQARGGLAAAASFLERAVALTQDPARRAERALAAARSKYQAGLPDAALDLLARVEAGPSDELLRAQTSLLRGQMAFASDHSGSAPELLLSAARRLEPLDVRLARETYLDALAAAMFTGRLAGAVGLPEVARAARSAPPAPRPPRAPDLLLDGLATLIADGYEAGTPAVRRAVAAFRDGELTSGDVIRWLFVACHAAHDLWDDEGWYALSARGVQITRDVGALSALPIALSQLLAAHLHAGEFEAAAALVEETTAITAATGNDLPPYSALALAGWRGHAAEATRMIQVMMDSLTGRGEGMGLSLVEYTSAVLNNGLGRYADALAAADRASAYPQELGFANWGLVELVEAAVRDGERARAADAVERLARTTGPSGTPWARGIEARSRALVSDDLTAEPLYREAVGQLARCRGAMPLARAHLVYGEWLRRANRRAEARTELRSAHDMFAGMGAEAFAERARRELGAAGESILRQTEDSRGELTAQEVSIARLARDGRTNAEIGAQLFLSARTVEWHMRKVFAKLGIASRRELPAVLS